MKLRTALSSGGEGHENEVMQLDYQAVLPQTGVVQVEDELIRYGYCDGWQLFRLTRGVNGTEAVTHDVGESVEAVSETVLTEQVQRMSEEERDLILDPVNGTTIYNTDNDSIEVWVDDTWETVAFED